LRTRNQFLGPYLESPAGRQRIRNQERRAAIDADFQKSSSCFERQILQAFEENFILRPPERREQMQFQSAASGLFFRTESLDAFVPQHLEHFVAGFQTHGTPYHDTGKRVRQSQFFPARTAYPLC
jgi:hypothetical protein